jgi:CRISPR/Cas system-associated protein Csm6
MVSSDGNSGIWQTDGFRDTYRNMKTTVNISDSLLDEARALAAQERTTVTALIEEGLRKTLRDRKRKGRFRLRKASFKGKGLNPDLADASWEKIRKLAYEERADRDFSRFAGVQVTNPLIGE